MKRYDIHIDHRDCWEDCHGCGTFDPGESRNGEWVRYTDAQAALDAERQRSRKSNCTGRGSTSPHGSVG